MDTACPSCGATNPASARFCMHCGAAMSRACANCGKTLPEGARFCPSCGAAVDDRPAPAIPATGPLDERRIVTILFVDLVGFTERSDLADPEDVRRTLVPFHTRVKRELERYGGTLDKFIGDAVMGVFGAPIAHEDDPERAIRAALQLLDPNTGLRADDPSIAVRIAVNTGEAVVTFGEGPQVGEAVAGDVVNTASRMQSAAPRNALVVGPETHEATHELFEFEELEPFAAKGKAEPLRMWRVLGEAAESGTGAPDTPLVGRQKELRELSALLAALVLDRQGAFVTIVGDPGMGKSRLLDELRRRTERRSEVRVRWVRGACLPYGDGVTFRGLGDVVRDLAGLEPTASPERAQDALGALADAEADLEDRTWLLDRLEALVGVRGLRRADEGGISVVSAREWASAVGRVLARRAANEPLVVEIEDVHWAEPVVRETIEFLAEELAGKPVVLLCTARPELLDLGPWGAAEGSTTMRLARLTDKETESLLSALALRELLPDDVREMLLDRAGGNPLYAREFARMASEHVVDPIASETVPIPTTVRALIGARLDAIGPDLRTIVQDASVVGATCWVGALVELSGWSSDRVQEAVADLVRRGVLRPDTSSWLPEQAAYGFTHALIREVAYERMPRLARAERHLAAGRWLEEASGDRASDRAESLAYQFASAAELAEAAGDADVAEAAREPAVRWLLEAGDQVTRVDHRAAFGLFERLTALAPAGSAEQATALTRAGLMGRRSGSLTNQETLERYERSLQARRALGDPGTIGTALVRVGSQLGAMGATARARETLDEAVAVLEPVGPSRELALALAYRAEDEMFAGRTLESVELAGRALELARRYEHTGDVTIMALHIRGDGRLASGDEGGLDDLHEALALADASGSVSDIVTSRNYLAEWTWALQGPAPGLEAAEAGVALAEKRGAASQGMWTKAGALRMLFEIGRWNDALTWADDLLALGPERLDRSLAAVANLMRSQILLLRGHPEETIEPDELLALARPTEEAQVMSPALVVAAELSAARSDADHALELLGEFDELTRDIDPAYRSGRLPEVIRRCLALGDASLAERICGGGEEPVTKRDALFADAARATLLEAQGDVAGAEAVGRQVIDRLVEYGCPFEEGHALLGRARCLEALDRPTEAEPIRKEAEERFERLGVRVRS